MPAVSGSTDLPTRTRPGMGLGRAFTCMTVSSGPASWFWSGVNVTGAVRSCSALRVVAMAFIASTVLGCGARTDVGDSAADTSETRWLRSCETLLDCDGLACIDTACTQWCEPGRDACASFGANARCVPRPNADNAPYTPPPGSDTSNAPPDHTCQMSCVTDDDCDALRRCLNATCQLRSENRPDGHSCTEGSDCLSGVCAGRGCGPEEGVCVAAMCTLGPGVELCSCSGSTFWGNPSCGPRYAHLGACAGE